MCALCPTQRYSGADGIFPLLPIIMNNLCNFIVVVLLLWHDPDTSTESKKSLAWLSTELRDFSCHLSIVSTFFVMRCGSELDLGTHIYGLPKSCEILS